jgi:hypothetical protein
MVPQIEAQSERTAGQMKSDRKKWKGAAEQLAYFDPRLAIDLRPHERRGRCPARQRLVEI